MYGFVGKNYASGFDTWTVFAESLTETDMLLRNPGKFFTNILHNPYESMVEYWNYFQINVFYKVVGVWNLFSGRNYYINALFFSFFTLYGYAFFIRIYRLYRPDATRLIILSWALLPGFIFWGSGMYKEGIIFAAISTAVYGSIKMFDERRYLIVTIAGVLVLGLIRAYTLFLLIPFLAALVAYTIGNRNTSKRRLWGYLLGVPLLLFAIAELTGVYSIPSSVAATRDAFLKLNGNSLLSPEPIAAQWSALLSKAPEALSYSLIRPYPSEAMQSIYYFAEASQTIIVLLLFLFWLLRKGWKQETGNAAVMLIIFALFSLTVIGLTVPFLGAIVRYKSIYLPFIVTPLVLAVMPEKIRTK